MPKLSLIAAATLAAIILAPRSGHSDDSASPAQAGFVSIYGEASVGQQAALSTHLGAGS